MVRTIENPLILFFPAGTHHLIDILMNPFIELFIDFQYLITESEILLQIRICTVGDDKCSLLIATALCMSFRF